LSDDLSRFVLPTLDSLELDALEFGVEERLLPVSDDLARSAEFLSLRK
jgi:hypothetical protein